MKGGRKETEEDRVWKKESKLQRRSLLLKEVDFEGSLMRKSGFAYSQIPSLVALVLHKRRKEEEGRSMPRRRDPVGGCCVNASIRLSASSCKRAPPPETSFNGRRNRERPLAAAAFGDLSRLLFCSHGRARGGGGSVPRLRRSRNLME